MEDTTSCCGSFNTSKTGVEVFVTGFRVGMEDTMILGTEAMPVMDPLELSGSI